MERRKSKDRKWNIIIKELEVSKEKRREAVQEILERIGLKAEIEKIRRIGNRMVEGKEMMVVRLAKKEQKKVVMRKKRNIKVKRKTMRWEIGFGKKGDEMCVKVDGNNEDWRKGKK